MGDLCQEQELPSRLQLSASQQLVCWPSRSLVLCWSTVLCFFNATRNASHGKARKSMLMRVRMMNMSHCCLMTVLLRLPHCVWKKVKTRWCGTFRKSARLSPSGRHLKWKVSTLTRWASILTKCGTFVCRKSRVDLTATPPRTQTCHDEHTNCDDITLRCNKKAPLATFPSEKRHPDWQ